MTEILRIDSHPGAQPVRCKKGWMIAALPPSHSTHGTFLIDAGGTDELPGWNEKPDGTHRLLLMMESLRSERVHLSLSATEPVLLEVDGRECRLSLLEIRVLHVDEFKGHSYWMMLSYTASGA